MSVLSINRNTLAANTANNLAGHYSRLAVSTQRLSSGLRINGAADDAAGLAIRELMRADISALEQGARNVNDAISMLQTFDGALGVIDEKLIRMKELAEQAATGTYDSTQRLMIDSEFQAMGSEIDRIARATDFNGVKLLCTKMITWYEDVTKFRADDPECTTVQISNANISLVGQNPPIVRGANPYNYVDENNPTKTISVSLTATAGSSKKDGALQQDPNNPTRYILGDTQYKASIVNPIGNAGAPIITYDASKLSGQNPTVPWSVDDGNTSRVYTVAYNASGLSFSDLNDPADMAVIGFSLEDENGANMDLQNLDSRIKSIEIDTKNGTYTIVRSTVEITTPPEPTTQPPTTKPTRR